MDTTTNEIETLRTLPVAELHQRFQALFGAKPTSRNRDYLAGKIARHAGGTAQTAQQKARTPKAPAKKAVKATQAATKAIKPKATAPAERDPRLPAAGTVITVTRKKKEHRVKVLADGFEYQGQRFTSLSAIARKITGHAANGFFFFKLGKPEQQ
jgi:hypothetical protein